MRILLAKIGLDGHDRGVKVLARSFRDAGIEVIYTGLWQTCEATIHAALQEDVDVVGVSLLSAAHMTVMPELIRLRDEAGIRHIPVVLGGIVPEADYPPLKEMGVAAVFNPGTPLETIIQSLLDLAGRRESIDAAKLTADFARGDYRALARIITAIQRDDNLDGWTPPPGRLCQARAVFCRWMRRDGRRIHNTWSRVPSGVAAAPRWRPWNQRGFSSLCTLHNNRQRYGRPIP